MPSKSVVVNRAVIMESYARNIQDHYVTARGIAANRLCNYESSLPAYSWSMDMKFSVLEPS
jgi:hypothetical protein